MCVEAEWVSMAYRFLEDISTLCEMLRMLEINDRPCEICRNNTDGCSVWECEWDKLCDKLRKGMEDIKHGTDSSR